MQTGRNGVGMRRQLNNQTSATSDNQQLLFTEKLYNYHILNASRSFLWLWPVFCPESGQQLDAAAIQGGAEFGDFGGDDAPTTDRGRNGRDPRGANRTIKLRPQLMDNRQLLVILVLQGRTGFVKTQVTAPLR